MGDNFVNTALLVRFAWRRDHFLVPVWIICIVGISVAVAISFPSIYPAGLERDILAQTLENPAMIAMIGPSYGQNDYHMGAVMAHQMFLFTAIAVAIMNITLAIRHTRRDEESGRVEIIRSLPVGKLSNAGATVIFLILVNLALAIFLALSLGVLGLEGMGWLGSIIYGIALGVVGIFFATFSIFVAQLAETARTTTGLTFAFLGLSYLLRAIGDVGSETLALLSPLGLILRIQVYVKNRWWPIFVLLVASVVFIYFAFRLNLRRDLEAGFFVAKPGRTTAPSYLRGPLGLAWRLQRVTVLWWTIGIFLLGVAYGSVFADLDAFFQTSDIFELLLSGTVGFSLTDQFVATLLAVMAMIGTIPVLIVLLKVKLEEQLNRTEQLLARPLSRNCLLGSYLTSALLVSVVVQLASVLGLWFAISQVMEDAYDFVWILKGGLAYLPVLWVMVSFTVLLIGFIPRLSNGIWLYLGYTFFVVYFGGLLKLPNWTGKLTPFGYLPDVPLEPISVSKTIIMLLLAAVLNGIGLIGYSKRDIYG